MTEAERCNFHLKTAASVRGLPGRGACEPEHQAGADSACRRFELRVWCTGDSWVAVVGRSRAVGEAPPVRRERKHTARGKAMLCPWMALLLPEAGQGYSLGQQAACSQEEGSCWM